MNYKALFALILLAGVLPADEKPRVPTVRATAEATVAAPPDRAVIEIGVVTQAPTAEAAGTQNAKQLTAVLAALKSGMPQGTQIQTSGYSMHPDYRQGEGRTPQITGYSVSNTVRVTIDDLEYVSKAIDAAAKVGGNAMHNLRFTLKDEEKHKMEALRQATQRARANAEAMAGALGSRIERVVAVEDGGPATVAPMQERMMMAKAVATPIESGSVEVRAMVTVTAEIAK